jgi:hypothetical protein
MGRQQRRQQQRRRAQRRQEGQLKPQKQLRAEPLRFNRWSVVAGVLVVLAAVGLFVYAVTRPGTTTTPSPVASKPVDGVQCNASEHLAYHIHQHIALYDHGKYMDLPSQIGMPGGEASVSCYYWLHVHTAYPNIIHVESPIRKIYTLGNFFDIWQFTKQWASPSGDAYVRKLKAAQANGQVTVFVNGRKWPRSYRSVPLAEYTVITVEIGKPIVPPKPYNGFKAQGL